MKTKYFFKRAMALIMALVLVLGVYNAQTLAEALLGMQQVDVYDEYVSEEGTTPDGYMPTDNDYLDDVTTADANNPLPPNLDVTVTFDGNGGNVAPDQVTRTTSAGTALGGQFPTMTPVRYGFVFRHWNTMQGLWQENPGIHFTSNTIVPDDMTVYAQWGRQVTFNINIPDFQSVSNVIIVPDGFSISDMPVTYGTPGATWPANPVRPGHIFMGWHTHFELGQGELYDEDTPILGPRSLYAQWEEDEITPYRVYFNPNGGHFASGNPVYRLAWPGMSIYTSALGPNALNQGVPTAPSASRTITHAHNGNVGSRLGSMRGPSSTGWHYTPDANFGTQFAFPGGGAHVPITSDMVDDYGNFHVYARWVYRVNFHTNAPSETMNIADTRDVLVTPETLVDGGTIAEWGTVFSPMGGVYVPDIGFRIVGGVNINRSLPSATRPGNVFSGWWNMQLPLHATDEQIAELGARQLTADCLINSSGDVWALWRLAGSGGDDNNKVFFDPNGGEWTHQEHETGYRRVPGGSNVLARWGTGWSNIPANNDLPPMPRFPTKPGYIFTGWFVPPIPGWYAIDTSGGELRDRNGHGGRRFNGNSHVPEGGVTVYARWLPYYTITFEPNGGYPGDPLTTYGNTRRIPRGWSMTQLFNVLQVRDPAHGSPYSFDYLDADTIRNGITRTGVAWETGFNRGWNTTADGTGTSWNANRPVREDITVYATWAEPVVFSNNHSSIGGTDSSINIFIMQGRSFANSHLHPNAPNTFPRVPVPMPTVVNWPGLFAPTHEFVGWNTQADGNGTWFDENIIIPLRAGPINVWAIWYAGVVFRPGAAPMVSILDENRHRTVDFDAPFPENTIGVSPGGWPSAPIWPNHTFRGWNTCPNGTLMWVGQDTPIPGRMALYAMWEAQVTFDPLGGTLAGEPVHTRNIGETIGVEQLPYATHPYRTFLGWICPEGQPFTATTPVRRSITVTAVWDIQVIFNANHGTTPATSTQSTAVGRIYSLAMSHADVNALRIRAGFTFEGWWTTPAEGGVRVFADTIVTNPEDHTLYARWRSDATPVTVTFNANHGETPATSAQPVTVGGTYATAMGHADVVALRNRTGFTFAGWWTTPAVGGVQVRANTEVINAENHTLYARWTESDVTIEVTFNANHGEMPATSTQPVTVGSTYATAMGHADVAALRTRTEFTFAGWWTTPAVGGIQVLANTEVTNAENHTLYARWTENDVTIEVTFNANHGEMPATSTQPVTVGSTYVTAMGHADVAALRTRTGFTFAGWWTTPADDGVRVFADTIVTNPEDHTLYARWRSDATPVTVTFNANHGETPATSTQPVIVGGTYAEAMGHAEVVALRTRTGFTFAGWWTTPAVGGVQVLAGTEVTNPENHTLYARWTEDDVPISVTFNANHGETPATSTQPVIVGGTYAEAMGHAEVVALRTRTGFTFAGWWTTPAVGGVQVLAGTEVTNAENHTLYARWTEDDVTISVTFNANHGETPATSTHPVIVGDTYAEAMGHAEVVALRTRTGFTFAGWWTTPAVGGVQVLAGTEVTNPENHTLYARWNVIPFSPPEVHTSRGSGAPIPSAREVIYLDYESIYYGEAPELIPIDPMHVSSIHHAFMIGFAEDSTIRPHANITRAEVSTIFFRLITDQHRETIWSRISSFADVQAEKWFNNPISTMERGGLFVDIPLGNSFAPNQTATRAEFAAMVVNYLGLGHYRVAGGNVFVDIDGHWASNAINVAYLQGWVNGFGDGTFRPDQSITRAEVAALINRALGRLPETVDDLLDGMTMWPDNMNPNTWYFLYIQEATNSHYHARKEDDLHETWTQLISPRNWSALERASSMPWDILED